MEIKDKINLKRLNSVLKKNTLKMLIMIVLFGLCGYYYSFNLVTPKYKSTSTILLGSNNLKTDKNSVTQTEVTLNTNLISTYTSILKSNNILGKVINNLSLDTTENELNNNIKVEEIEKTQIIKVSVMDYDANQAQKIANELDKVFIEEIKKIYKINNINIVDEASLEEKPYNVNHIKDITIAMAIGIFIASIYVSIIYLFDTSIKLEEDIEEFVDLKVIGSVPKFKVRRVNQLIVLKDGKSIISESLKAIRTNIAFVNNKTDRQSILFTSCNPGEGKSIVAANMAVAYSQSNKNVILVDTDMRKGRQHSIFRVRNTEGLSNCLRELNDNEEENFAIIERNIKETLIPNVHVLTIGDIPPNPSELLLSDKMKQLVKMLKCVYDVVILDGSPCNLVSDSLPVSKIADTTVLVAESRKTKIEELNDVIKQLKNADANIAGVILNKKEIKRKEYRERYYNGSKNKNNNIEIERHTVNELIENRREYIYEDEIQNEEKNREEELELLYLKMEDLQEELNKIPNINLDNYKQTVEEIKKAYNDEIDKNKLAEEIKNNVIKDELISKIEENDIRAQENLNKKIEEINYQNEINELLNKVDYIEEAITNDESEEKIENLIKNELINKIEESDAKTKKDLSKQIEQIDYQNEINEIIKKVNSVEEAVSNKDNEEKIKKLIYDIKGEQRRNFHKIDYRMVLNNISNEIKKLNHKYSSLRSIEEDIHNNDLELKLNEMILDMQEEQNRQIRVLDNSRALNDIIIEIQKLDRKYKKVEDLEKAIINDKTDEKINKMLEKMQNDNYKKLDKIDNSTQIKEIMKELKKINTKYDKLVEKITTSHPNKKTKTSKSTTRVKDNVIEIAELKNKMNKKELTIEYGSEVNYEDLLNMAVEIYEIKEKTNTKKA